ncbi:MAG: GGDEF domain-containing protein [Thermoanaerobaculia bacterium]|nr:GGDEF domain-containing protein [Thermoanaerobaculia bacterium]
MPVLGQDVVSRESSPASPNRELGRPYLQHFGSNETGNHDQIWKGMQLDDGALLFAEGRGLRIFDGVHWYGIGDPAIHRVYDMALSDDGRIYLGSAGELGYLEPQSDGTYKYFSLLPSAQDSASEVPAFGDIRRVVVTETGVLYAGYETLFGWRTTTGLIWAEIDGITGLQEVEGEVWLTTDEEVYSVDPVTLSLRPVPGTEALHGNSVSNFSRRPDGAWQALGSEGLFVQTTEGFQPWPTAIDGRLGDTRLTSQTYLADGTLVLGTRNQGAYLLDPHGDLIQQLGEPQGLTELWVTSAFEDIDGNLWLTHGSQGITRIERSGGLSLFERDLGIRNTQQITRHRGHLFAATYFGLEVLVPARDSSDQAHFETASPEPNVAWSLLDLGDSLLVGGVDGIYEIRILDESVQPPRVSATRITEDHPWVSAMSRDRSQPDTVYATLGSGLLRLDRTSEGWASRGRHDDISAHTYFVEEDAGQLWVGTVNEGYLLLSDLDLWPSCPVQTFGRSEGVPAGNSHIFRWNDGLLWGTYDGVYSYDPKRAIPFAPDSRFAKGLIDGSVDVHRFFDPGAGEPWMIAGGVTGPLVTAVDGSYEQDDRRLRSPPDWRRYSLHIDDDGIVWIGAREGIIRHDPRQFRPLREPQSAVRLGRVTDLSGDETLWGGEIPWPDGGVLSLARTGGGLRFDFGLQESVVPGRIQYRSRLAPLGADWSAWSFETYRDFTNLPGGSLHFEVEARDARDRQSLLSPVAVEVPLSWYATGPGRILLASLLAFLIWVIARWRTAKVVERNVQLERAVDERTREVQAQATALAEANERLQEMSQLDLLTGLGNRRMAAEMIDEEIDWLRGEGYLEASAERSHDLSFLLVDVDHFKRINDTYGHAVGDRVLKSIGALLQEQSRALDGVMRWGGEEFLVLCRRTPRERIGDLAERLRRAIERAVLIEVDGQEVKATVSIGFATFPLDPAAPLAVSWNRVLGVADLALYAAKRSGRDGWVGLSVEEGKPSRSDGDSTSSVETVEPISGVRDFQGSEGTLSEQVRRWLESGKARVSTSFSRLSDGAW